MNYTPIILSSLETMLMGEKLKKESVSSFKVKAYKKAIDAINR
jgi:hypothetical protein